MKERVKELVEIIRANPELEVEFLVDSETICEDFAWTRQEIISIEIEDVWIPDGDMYYGEDDIREKMDDMSERADEEEREKEINERYSKEVKKVILVKLSA